MCTPCPVLLRQADALEEEQLLIYNWKPEYTGRHMSGKEEEGDFMQSESTGKTLLTDGGVKFQCGAAVYLWLLTVIVGVTLGSCMLVGTPPWPA